MKFEKINDNKLKITLSVDELPNSQNLDDFMNNSDNAKNSFLNILNEAKNAVGFNTQDYKIKIEAKSIENDGYVFLITRLVKLKNGNVLVKPRKIFKHSPFYSDYSIYKFSSFDDFCNFSSYLKENKINYLNNLCKSCTLYGYGSHYYLVLEKINENYKKLPLFYSSITEFSTFFSSKEMFYSSLKEHGKIILESNALVLCQKYF